jgi:hypothetical protein
VAYVVLARAQEEVTRKTGIIRTKHRSDETLRISGGLITDASKRNASQRLNG